MEDPNRKPTKAHVCVRVRPFTEAEANVCPEDSPVPREVVVWDCHRSLTVLDAANGFVPRKNGQFDIDNVLWSFRDEERPKMVLHTQKDVYSAVVAPMIPQILDGYNTAFCVAGATGGGRVYSLYGDDVDGLNRGILPRFAENIFNAFKREKHENIKINCEIEAVDVSPNETYVDLLAQRRRTCPTTAVEELKLVHDATEGIKLQGVTRVEVGKAADVLSVLRQLSRVVPKRSGCHTVHFRFVETFDFADPEQQEQVVSKSRRISVLFVLLRNMPAAFHRCIDVAVEHDSGENPLAKVPVRETAFTKLYPDLFQQGYNLSFLCCVSPFYEHARESVQTLVLATKFMKLKCRPRLMHDEALMELRNLSEEVKNLKTEVVKQMESTQIVQQELNLREVELMKQEAAHHGAERALRKAEEAIALARHAIVLNRYRTERQKKNFEHEHNTKMKRLSAARAEKEEMDKSLEEEMKRKQQLEEVKKTWERKVEARAEKNAAFDARLKADEAKEKQMERMQKFIAASQEERRRILAEETKEKFLNGAAAHANELTLLREAQNKADGRCHALEKDYAVVSAAEKGTVENAEVQKENARLKKEIVDVEAEIVHLQAEIGKRQPGCQCVFM
ncbi:putative kinesin-like protein [Trypanosoma rangeli]|uniref:Putative kinesin-like protein n=1 Tax=Trypanosoma rangeli TaxID=5698 RepID=A0A422NMD1_TRYRA|nr:putative kinesin-like protein [Trypanosoma rangeli]RNF06586.1 putative kinesin-like protein [Trypanosoma rangeli]|eukprot:RNF06586.1 putative kinesin-like protein [Trypanosoma rangeli]